MKSMTSEIRRRARELFDSKRIDMLVGFTNGSVGYRCRPILISSAAQIDKLEWDSTCSNNLAVYLPPLFAHAPRGKPPDAHAPRGPRIGFVVKGCDMRSIVALVKENQARRESMVLVGVPCRGMIDEAKLDSAARAAGNLGAAAPGSQAIKAVEDCEETVEVALVDGRSVSLAREPLLQDACLSCMYPSPEGADILIEGASRIAAGNGDGQVDDFAALEASERWLRFQQEMSRCIRCYACRQACPTCYCKECFAEMNSPAWIGISTELTDTTIFHLIRVFHQAGRCVECDACLRACPMGIDLRTLTKKIAVDVRRMFGFTPDFNIESSPPLTAFKDDDDQGFITEPGRR